MKELIALISTAPRQTCEEILATTNDGDLLGLVQARIKFLDNIQKKAQTTIYRETPPGMVDSWQLRDWWYENFQTLNITDIDFHVIAENKKQEWYAYLNAETETLNQL